LLIRKALIHKTIHAHTDMSSMTTPPRRLRSAAQISLVSIGLLLLASCGGGSGGEPNASNPIGPPVTVIQPSSAFAGTLINSGQGASANDWVASTCTDARQKNWVRSYLNEDYLFYREAPLTTIDPNTYTNTVQNLFLDYTVRGVPAKDRFSFVLTQAQADAAFQSGQATTVGFTLRRDPTNGNIVRIAYVDPNGPAAAAEFRRGQVLATVDGVATANGLTQALSDKLFASPAGTSSVVGVQDTVGGAVRNITVATARFNTTPLLVERILPGQIAYIAYNSFSTPIGEVQLADAFARFASAGVTDAVVDLRYNGGGFLDIASQLGFELAGRERSINKTFERLVYNDKRTADNVDIQFRDRIAGFPGNEGRANEPLASLNLARVYIITTGSTCSASESVINALQGVDVQVILVGGTTCGKPYGFSQDNNCTLSYFGLEFEGRNQKGAITPVTGVPATCPASDDFEHQLGDTAERMLAVALSHRQNGACPPATALAAKSAQARAPDQPNPDMELVTNPLETIKLLRAKQRR
jgi:carboxyl-terminal processing protease